MARLWAGTRDSESARVTPSASLADIDKPPSMFDVDAKKPRLAIGRGLVNAEKIMRGASIGRRWCCFTAIAGCLQNRRCHGGFDSEYLWILGHRRPNASAAAHPSANICRLVAPQGQSQTRYTLQTLSLEGIETRLRLKAQRRPQAPPSLATLSEGPIPIRTALQETNILRRAAMGPHLEKKSRSMVLSQSFIVDERP